MAPAPTSGRPDGPLVGPLVSPEWLGAHLDQPGIQVIAGTAISDAYLSAHIAGAIVLPCHPHLKQFDTDGELTQHMMAAPEFGALCHLLGLRRDKHYVVYDDRHGLLAARFWAVARFYGVDNVSVLDGGWQGWLAQEGPIATRGLVPMVGTDVEPAPRPQLCVDLPELQRIHDAPAVQLWDTRRREEFTGEEETDNRRRGHLPGALHLAWTDLLSGDENDENPRFVLPREQLGSALTGLGLRREQTVITYCQSGIRAAFCLLVLHLMGFDRARLYDASMGEWANRDETPLNGPSAPRSRSD